MRKFLVSAVVVMVAVTLATAEQFNVLVSGLETKDGKTYVTGKKFGGGAAKDKAGGGKKGGGGIFGGEEVSIPLDSGAKYYKAKINDEKKVEKGDAITKADFEKAVEDAKAKGVKDKAGDKGDKGAKKGGIGGGLFGGGVLVQLTTEGEKDSAKVTQVDLIEGGIGALFGGFGKDKGGFKDKFGKDKFGKDKGKKDT